MYKFTSIFYFYIVKNTVWYCYYANNSYLCSMFWRFYALPKRYKHQ